MSILLCLCPPCNGILPVYNCPLGRVYVRIYQATHCTVVKAEVQLVSFPLRFPPIAPTKSKKKKQKVPKAVLVVWACGATLTHSADLSAKASQYCMRDVPELPYSERQIGEGSGYLPGKESDSWCYPLLEKEMLGLDFTSCHVCRVGFNI